MTTTLENLHWEGGASPFGVSWQKLMMWVFIVGDGILFAGFLASYGFSRLAADQPWPDRGEVFNMALITVMTFVLISSSATMASAVAASKRRDLKAASRFVWFTILGGAVFLGMQAFEWSQLIHEGASLTENPFGGPVAFTSFFFMMTGFHGLHVSIGVLILLITALRTAAGKVKREGVELAGLYWHFVDLVWVFIFGCFYLI